MTPQQLRERLHSGKTILGTLIVSPSPRWPEAVQSCGLDFVFIDTEHIALDRSQLSWMCQAYTALGLPAIVRIPSPDPYSATMVLDGGAAGVIAPYVESPQQVQALRGAVKMRPIKGQRLERMLDGGPIEPELDKYLRTTAESRLLIVNIESIPAIESLDDILAVPGLDAVLIGPHDLTCSLGIPEQYDHPEFLAAFQSQISTCWGRQSLLGQHRSTNTTAGTWSKPIDPQWRHLAVSEAFAPGHPIAQKKSGPVS